jgi:hypothetical protein
MQKNHLKRALSAVLDANPFLIVLYAAIIVIVLVAECGGPTW